MESVERYMGQGLEIRTRYEKRTNGDVELQGSFPGSSASRVLFKRNTHDSTPWEVSDPEDLARLGRFTDNAGSEVCFSRGEELRRMGTYSRLR